MHKRIYAAKVRNKIRITKKKGKISHVQKQHIILEVGFNMK